MFNHADDDNSRAAISAYAFICVVFVLYVLALDVVACVYSHQKITEYSTTYDQSLFHYTLEQYSFMTYLLCHSGLSLSS